MTLMLLKKTKSLSPVSLREIDAEIRSDGKNIYMVKKDEKGREYKTLIEKDVDLYLLLTKPAGEFSAKMQFLSVYVSSKCNLQCQVCYEKHCSDSEIAIEELKNILKNNNKCKIALTGMEPTCRQDIFDMIKVAGNRASLITNGIKLKSAEYVEKLKAAGLRKIFISFNGLNDDVYSRINGANLIDVKLRALNNIKLAKIDTLLSATLIRGINEDQILPLIKLCFDHRSFILELRLRTLAPTGKYLSDTEPIVLSELIQMVADSLDIDTEDIIREFKFLQTFIRTYNLLLPKGFKDKYGIKLCSFIFHLRKERNGKYSSPGSLIDLDRINKSSFKPLLLLYYLFKAYGPLLLMETALHVLNLPRIVFQKNILNITLKCWPNLYNIDLAEMNKCPSAYYKNGAIEKFCISNIINSAKKEKLVE